MFSKSDMVRALSQLRPMVKDQNFAQIDAFAAEWGLDFLISDEFIDFSRRVKDPASVIFLSTLAVHNAKNPVRPQMILQAYQSIAASGISAGIAQLPKRHVLRQVIASLAEKSPLPPTRLDSQKRKGTGQEWLLAMELCMDHGAPASALMLLHEHLRSTSNADFLLLCAKALIERASGITASDALPWKEWIALQSAVFNELKRQKQDAAAEAVVQLLGEYCHFAGDQNESITWYRKIARSSDKSIIAQYQSARAYGHMQDFENALQELDEVLVRVCGQSNDWINKNFLNADADGDKSSNAKFNLSAAASALTDLQTSLSAVGLSPFLVSGTLLGYARNRGFLSHDKDIDVGIFASQNIFDVVTLLSQNGLFDVKYKYLRMEKTYQVPIIHRPTGMSIDIFVYHPHDDKLITGVQGNFGYTQNFTFTPFALETVKFLDIDFAIPADASLNLQENFGPWQVPDPYFISHLECPTTVDVGGTVYMVVARLEMLRALVEGKKIKVDRIAKILRHWSNAPYAMATELIDRLEHRFGTLQGANQPAIEHEAPAHA
ncbi:MAG: LicD family protein [Rhodoferax sp.]|nr:LicD family protein [Rhodoferax sp.]